MWPDDHQSSLFKEEGKHKGVGSENKNRERHNHPKGCESSHRVSGG